MSYIVAVWIVWGILALVLLGLMLYHIHLTRYEEDRLFLDGGSAMQHRDQDQMFAKLKRLRPAIRIFGGIEGLATLALVGFYVVDALRQF